MTFIYKQKGQRKPYISLTDYCYFFETDDLCCWARNYLLVKLFYRSAGITDVGLPGWNILGNDRSRTYYGLFADCDTR